MSSTIESVLQETRVFPPSADFIKQANVSGMEGYRKLCAEAERDFEGFWGRLAKEHVLWHKPFTKVLDESKAPFYRWFHDGELNVSHNCLDRHLKTQPDKTAIIFEADDGKVTKITYKALYHEVCRMANALKAHGVKMGDRVLIYMPMSIQVVVAMQACARIGATHSVVFGGFSAKSLQERIIDAGATEVITADGQFRGGKEIPLKPVVDEAFAMGGCEKVRNVIVYKRTGSAVPMQAPRDKWWDDVLKGQPDTCEPTWVNAEHPLFILYTSGSTGKPKGVQHSTGGYLLWAALTMKWVFDNKPSDVFWCTADVGWVTGHTYITYGPLAVGTTEVMFEGVPTYPDAGRFWKIIQDHKVNVFYTAPTAIRSLIKAGGDLPKKYNLKSLRILGTVGEPINPEAWMWYHETFPLPGIITDIVDETGQPVGKGKGGILVIKRPWPSMIRTIWGDPERFKKSYYPEDFKGKYYLAGDGASTDQEGYYRIMGRIDDVLNVSGHRLGTMEIESALVANSKLVAEAAVVGRPDDLTGEAVCAFVVLKGPRPSGEEAKKIAQELRNWVAKEIGPIARPKDIRFGDNLPKTRSGKIMRRLLRAIAKGEEIKQDVSTLENPAILEQLKQVS
jgi:acetyl-CoA synthetase